MKKERPRRLRWRLAVPLAVAFALLWLGTMKLLTDATVEELDGQADLQSFVARKTLDEGWNYYKVERAEEELGARAEHNLAEKLSNQSMGLIWIEDGGMALLVRDEAGTVIRSQLAWGYGFEKGMEQETWWYLYFDSGLDDQGQIDLARWIVAHRKNWSYTLYPMDSWYVNTVTDGDLSNCDGTYARVTGVEKPGRAVDVQKIELVHPDGAVETVVETATPGEDPIVLDLCYVDIKSVILPSWSSDADGNTKDGSINMARRLANFRAAQAVLDRELGGEALSFDPDRCFVSRADGESGLIQLVAGQCDTLAAAIRRQTPLYVATFLLTAAVVLLLSAYLSQKVTQPVEELSRASKAGRCGEDGPVTELNTLAAAFNAAQDQLAGQLERERAFTRAAAHELKTPLAVLRTHAEALREDIAPGKRDQYLDVVLDESDRMAALVASLLELSRLESGATLHREAVELSALVEEVWRPLALPLEQKGIALTLDLAEVRLDGDRARLKEAVGNLATNALRHCPVGKTIRVTLAREDGAARLSVCNDGPPIPAEDLPHLWEPFYRGDPSRSRESGGTGLGLAIVRAATVAHGGSYFAENRDEGVCFQLLFPIKDE